MAVPGVVGVALGERGGTPTIRVLVERRSPELEERLPDTVDAVPVEIHASGRLRAVEEESPDRPT